MTLVASGTVNRNAPSNIRVSTVRIGGRDYSPEEFQRLNRAGRFAGYGSFFRTPQQAQQQAAQEQARIAEILQKSEKQLLTPQERAELKQLSIKTVPTRMQVTPKTQGLSPLERYQAQQMAQVEGIAEQLRAKDAALALREQELMNRLKVLQKQADTGVLQAGVVARFNTEISEIQNERMLLEANKRGFNQTAEQFQKLQPSRGVSISGAGAKAQPTAFLQAAPS